MARIFYGNKERFDELADVTAAISDLDDSFWFLLEFDLNGANIDCLVIRPTPERATTSSTMIMTEIKHVSGRLKGLENGTWTIDRGMGEEEYHPSNARDINPWQQMLRAVNALRDWTTANQLVFLDVLAPYPATAIRFWPTLLILRSDSDERHSLPLQPQSRFGSFAFSIAEWLRNVEAWRPSVGINVTTHEVAALVSTLNLTEYCTEPASGGAPTMPELPILPDATWVDSLREWVASVERRLAMLESRQ